MALATWPRTESRCPPPPRRPPANTLHRVPRPVTDGSGHVVANLVGCPGDPSWERVHRQATELLREAGGRIHCGAKDTYHRRGNFKVLAQGIRYGTGMKKPGNANNTQHNVRVMDSLMSSKEFIRVASFTNSKCCTINLHLSCLPPSRLHSYLAPPASINIMEI